ncbi:MAG: hypothetical protein KJP22_13550 [Acidimicrobiia bacterium]|nr:hypothetical protein [Acidimicrobiia bacterium]NNF10128.1 hypothetical protein [Acidimicrobiia bacterium]
MTCGNYQRVSKPIIWQRADTVVWLDLPKPVVLRALVHRSVRRAWQREELWNGNRERFGNLLKTRNEDNILLWAWAHFDSLRDRYSAAIAEPSWAHLDFVRLRSRREVSEWLAGVGRTRNQDGRENH